MTFEPTDFIRTIGDQLVLEFERASMSGTPTLIGDSRESPARGALAVLLPGFVAVGSGIVIDGARAQSKQRDIVVYEGEVAPTFSINGVTLSRVRKNGTEMAQLSRSRGGSGTGSRKTPDPPGL